MSVRSIMKEILGNIQDRLGSVEERMTGVEKRLLNVESRTERLEFRLEQGLREAAQDRAAIRGDIAALTIEMRDQFANVHRGNEAVLEILRRVAETNRSYGEQVQDHEERIAALEGGREGRDGRVKRRPVKVSTTFGGDLLRSLCEAGSSTN